MVPVQFYQSADEFIRYLPVHSFFVSVLLTLVHVGTKVRVGGWVGGIVPVSSVWFARLVLFDSYNFR